MVTGSEHIKPRHHQGQPKETDPLRLEVNATNTKSYLSTMPQRGEGRALVAGDDDDVRLNDADSALSDDDHDGEALLGGSSSRSFGKRRGGGGRRNRRNYGSRNALPPKRNSTCIMLLSWLMLLLLFAIGIIGLMMYRHHVFLSSHPALINAGSTFNQESKISPQTTGPGSASPNSSEPKLASSDGSATNNSTSTDGEGDDTDGIDDADDVTLDAHHDQYVHYNPSAFLQQVNPFDFATSSTNLPPDTLGGGIFMPPLLFDNEHFYEMADEDLLGYLQHPDLVNDVLVFCAEGDLYITSTREWVSSTSTVVGRPFGAMKLTTTVGNVLDPRINPVYPHWVAFTAT